MNIRNASNYTIGLDLGTGSVGWAVTDSNGELYTRNGKHTLGARLFPNAETAATTRIKRGQRRRYDRRRQRIDQLQNIFEDEMAGVDPDFFPRLRQSSLIESDRSEVFSADRRHALFNGSDFSEKEYYDQFPTIWHLRHFLASSTEKADIRLIYLALHNIVKYRGNFLREDETGVTATNANASSAVSSLTNALLDYFDLYSEEGVSAAPDIDALEDALDAKGMRVADRAKQIEDSLHINDAKMAKAVARACVGYKVEFSNIFFGLEKSDVTNLSVTDEEKRETFLSVCPDDALEVFEAIERVRSAYALSSILKGASSISEAMIESYEQHKSDLTTVKGLIRDHLGLTAYRKMFRGPKNSSGLYDINKLPKNSYTAYIAGEKLANKMGCSHEDFLKNLRKVLSSSSAILNDERYKKIENRLNAEDSDFLIKQKTRANGAIPFQLHMEEMDAIIECQGKFYPFLIENKKLLDKLVSSRIPYYVGPLNTERDPEGFYPSNNVDHSRKFAWSVRLPGKEHVAVYPWNVDEVIDRDKTAELFIRRMTGTCTYLYGEPVIPRCSLLYEEFCVLNELNGAKWCEDGGQPHRFDWADREEIVEDLFKSHKSVSSKLVANWLRLHEEVINPVLSGTQAENGFESKLNSYNDFCKILGVKYLEDDNCPLSYGDIEQIILWNTVFEDRSIFKRKLEQEYGEILNAKQIRKLVNKRYTGWGRLSNKLLTKVRIPTTMGPMSIMDILRHGDPITGHHRQAMTLMEILHEDAFGFEKRIDEENSEYFKKHGTKLSIDDMQGSPALRRSVNQAMHIIEEIVSITGEPPARICIEVTRDDDRAAKGRRTSSRYQKLVDAIGKLKEDAHEFDKEVLSQLRSHKNELNNEKLVLYFMQNGKSLYSGRAIDINQLSQCEVDHILPRCYIKDDSFDNKALVYKDENQRKLDSLLLDESIINSQKAWWKSLHSAGLISDKKFKNLTCRSITERMLKGFINRQLVETSQIVKFVRQMCEQRYPNTQVISVKASLSHGLRDQCALVKCRELNNYHHAHDAYLACEMARFIEYRYPKWQDGFDLAIVRKYVKSLGKNYSQNKRIPGQSGFIVSSFLRDGFDRDTGEVFKDEWDASAVVDRIRRVMGYKDIFITRMLEEQTGTLWDETVYSPRDNKNGKNLFPLKGFGTDVVLNPSVYGGYNKVKQAYFFAFRAKDKKGNWKDFFEGVPIHLVQTISSSPTILREYAESIAVANKCSDAQVLRAKIPLRQKFELEGSAFYLFGRSTKTNEIRSANEIAGDLTFVTAIRNALKLPEALSQKDKLELYQKVTEKLNACCPRLAELLKLDDYTDQIEALEVADYSKLIDQIVRVCKGELQGCNLSMFSRSPSSGFMLINLASKLKNIIWIDESVSGMSAKRTTYQDLINGI